MKQKLSLLFKILIVIMSLIGLYLNFKVAPIKSNIIYFTIQSNLLCFLFYLVIVILKLIGKLQKNRIYYITKGTVTMAITITMFIYESVLATSGTMGIYEEHMFACNFVHLVVPLMVIFDYIIFGEKGNLEKKYPLYWSSVLVAYLIFYIIYVSLGGTFMGGSKYPYYYMNIEKYGIVKVLINNISIYAAFLLYGMFVQKLDVYWSKKHRKV